MKCAKLHYILTPLLLACSHHKMKTESRDLPTKKAESNEIVKTLNYDSGPTIAKDPVFIDKTASYGLYGVKATHLYVVDFDHDGANDLAVLPDFYSIPEFYRFNSKLKKFERLDVSPVNEVVRASYLNFVDYNGDGITDMVAGTLNQKSELVREPLRFFKGELREGKISYQQNLKVWNYPPMPTASISFADIDLDGDLDLYLANWYDLAGNKPKPYPDKLYIYDKDQYQDVSDRLVGEAIKKRGEGDLTSITPSYGVSSCDIDQNGYPDFLTASSGGYPNRLWMNQIKDDLQTFADVGEISGYAHDNEGAQSLVGGGNSLYSLCADYNNDGIMDIILGTLSHAYDQASKDRSTILTGSQSIFPPKFLRTEYYRDEQGENWDQGDRRGVWFDYNLDGNQDLLIENSGFPPHSRLILFEQEKDHAFTDKGSELGIDIVNPSGPVVLDLNGDGLQDIIVGQTSVRDDRINSRIYIFENHLSRGSNRSLKINLGPIFSNKDLIGAMVILKSSGRIQRRYLEYSNGPLQSQNSKELFFGLDDDKPLSLEVRWPYIEKKEGRASHYTQAKRYDISSLKYRANFEITVCENGRWKRGKSNCRQ